MLPLFSTDRLAGFWFGVSCLVWLLPEGISAVRHNAGRDATIRDRYSGYAVFAGIFLALGAGFGFAYGAREFAITWQRPLVFFAGIVLVWAGVVFRRYAIRVLGKYFTRQVAVHVGQTVVEAGPYRWIRHPAYSGTLLTMLGLGLAMTNWLSLVCMLVFSWLGHEYRVWVEERALIEALGQPYREYMRRTRRFIPFVY